MRRQFHRTKSEAGKDRRMEFDEDLQDFFQDDLKIDEDLVFKLSDNESDTGNQCEANDCGNKSNDFGLESEMFEDEFDYDDESLIHEITTNQSKITTTQGEITSKQSEITTKQDEITKKLDGQVNPRFEGKFNLDQT